MEYPTCELCRSGSAHAILRQRDLLHHVSAEEFTIVKCEGCGLLYLNPRPTEAEIGQFYPPQYFGPPSPPRTFSKIQRWILEDFYGYPATSRAGAWQRLRKILLWPEKVRREFCGRVVLPWVGRGRLLDVGCGHGVSAAIRAQQGWEVHGVDLSESAVNHARSLLGDRVQVGDLASVRYEDQAFDVVLLSHSLEHMYHLSDVLAEVRRILDDGGVLVIAVPNAGSVEARVFGRWWVNWDPPRHLYHFDKSTLSRLLERSGFRVVRARTGVTPAYFMGSLERVWTYVLGRELPARRLIEKLVARPFCLVAGHLGYGTEITVYAVKQRPGAAHRAPDTHVPVAG